MTSPADDFARRANSHVHSNRSDKSWQAFYTAVVEPLIAADEFNRTQAAILRHDALATQVSELTDRLRLYEYRYDGPCICDTGPTSDGPEECCPYHGRAYNEWVERCSDAQRRLSKIRRLLDEPLDSLFADSLRAIIDAR